MCKLETSSMTPALSGILNINPHARSRERQSQTAGGSKKIAVPQVDWTSDEKEGKRGLDGIIIILLLLRQTDTHARHDENRACLAVRVVFM